MLGTTQNELGLRKWLEDQGHTLVTTSDKEGENSTFDKELVDAEIIITTPYVSFLFCFCCRFTQSAVALTLEPVWVVCMMLWTRDSPDGLRPLHRFPKLN